MLIQDLFEKNIERRIDGVVKADQVDQDSLWLELDEFVLTAEVRKHLIGFFSAVKDSFDAPNDPAVAGRSGVWLSGFFGSGKSMLLKILSLMIENRPVNTEAGTRTPLEFVLPKLNDSLTAQDIAACCSKNNQSVLFNIDAKSQASLGDAAVLDVFLRVFNERRGRCADVPDVAEFEDVLEERGWLDQFKTEFEALAGRPWSACAKNYRFHMAEISSALMAAGGVTKDEAARLADAISGMASISPEKFAELVAKHLNNSGPDARIFFFVDEIGQFIGRNGRLMLSLQTITEQLGTKTKGRAWVVVTAQEDLDSILGELPEQRANDFSKIQGRFAKKFKLSSSNADEVIQRRLLVKSGSGEQAIKPHFERLQDILRNAITFKSAGMRFQSLGDSDNFITEYPFLPYQFQLLPKIFTAIRKRGVTGQNLSEGERSMLDAFQIAALGVGQKSVGALVPLHGFYPAIEGYLEGVVKRTIDRAPGLGLNERAVDLLKTLFLIRWVEEVKGNVETLVTLSLGHMDEDRAKLKAEIEASLQQLEKQTLVSRSGENYYFLTDEEQAVDRQIRQVDLKQGDESRLIGSLIFGDLLKDQSKHRFGKNNKDFTFLRQCDGFKFGSASGAELEVRIITPFDSEFELYSGDSKGVLVSKADECLIIVLDVDSELSTEITRCLKVESYHKAHYSADLPIETKRIIEDRGRENGERRNRLVDSLKDKFAFGRFYAAGQRFTPASAEPTKVIGEALEFLINTSFSQLGLLIETKEKPLADLNNVLKFNNTQKVLLDIETSENRAAIAAVKQKISALAGLSRQILVSEMAAEFGRRPYGWPDNETILIIGRLIAAGEIQLLHQGVVLANDQCFDPLSKPGLWKQVIIQRKESVGEQELAAARALAQVLFHSAVPSPAEDAVSHIRSELDKWQKALLHALPYTNQADRYPGRIVVNAVIEAIKPIQDEKDSKRFVDALLLSADKLKNLQPKHDQVTGFYNSQRPAWEKVFDTYQKCRPNESGIREQDPAAAQALADLRTIITSPEPYNRIPEAKNLAEKVEAANKAAIEKARENAKAAIVEIQEDLDKAISPLDDQSARDLQAPLRDLKDQVDRETSLGNLHAVRETATQAYNAIIQQINQIPASIGVQPLPKAKPIRTIRPPAKTLETPADVDAYLQVLKTQILTAIENGEKVQVQ